MFNIFKKKKEKAVDEMSIKEILENYPHCKAMNLHPNKMDGTEDDVWLNPHNQQCFNYGNFKVEDFRNWAKGTGKIVKGGIQSEKDKVMYYAKMYNKLDYRLFMYYEYFHLLKGQKKVNGETTHSYYFKVKNPLRKNQLAAIYYNHAVDVQHELKYLDSYKDSYLDEKSDWYKSYKDSFERSKGKMRYEIFGQLRTLYLLGSGYYGASNTPTDLQNLSWARDLIWAYGYYLHLTEDMKLEMPDFDYVNSVK